ncbi:MAG: hypothetical protein MUF07_18160 [Steroidobacteraceae bacterium]|jgi:hypothetical protein|nr:hypothetical protein [Steroidobacteraceae bacterium]
MKQRSLRILGATVAMGATLLAGCKDAREDRFEGARRALTALPDLEIVSSDAAAGVLTVRSRTSGEVTTIELGARPPASGQAPVAAAGPAATAAAPGTAAPAPQADRGEPGTGAAPGTAAAPAAEATAATAAGSETATAATVAAASIGAPVVVRDPQGRVQVIEGSGFRIERAPVAAVPGAVGQAVSAAPATRAATGGELRRITVPVVCANGETRALQGVLVDVPGAGIVAERGCNLSVANVRVRSGGWGLVVNPGATVRIDDSVIEGRTGALDLYPGAALSAWATTFRGPLGRPVAAPQFVDRGGNRWQ